MHIHAGILIGGRSKRMGRPKALIEHDGVTLIERTFTTVRSIVDTVALLGSEIDFPLPDSCGEISILPDAGPNIGPLGGLASLLNQCRPDDAALLLACDMPFLSGELIDRLRTCGRTPSIRWDAIVPTTRDTHDANATKLHPCSALYRPTCIPAIERAISGQRYGMMRLLDQLTVREVPLLGDEARWVTNWNTPADIPDGV